MIDVYVKAKEFLPVYKTEGAAGADLKSLIDIIVAPKQTVVIPTGLNLEIPEGYEAQIRPRSGLAAKKSVMAVIGTIDSDYRGDVGVIFYNFGEEAFEVKKGDRIAQIVFNKVEQANFLITDKLSDTNRGEKGFGSSGV